jgi:hypothetical protein
MCIKMVTGQWGYVGIYIMYAIQVIFFCIFVSFIWICLSFIQFGSFCSVPYTKYLSLWSRLHFLLNIMIDRSPILRV